MYFLTCISATFSKQAVKALARLCVCAWADPEGMGGTAPPPLKNHNTIGLPSNAGPDPHKNHKVTEPAFNVGLSYVRQAFRCWADVGPLMVVFGSSLPSSTKKKPLSKSDPLWQNFLDLRKMRKLVRAFTVNKFMMYERYLSCNITIV